MYTDHRKLAIFTHVGITVGLLLIFFLVPNSFYKLWLIALFPLIWGIPFDIKWMQWRKEKKKQEKEKQENLRA